MPPSGMPTPRGTLTAANWRGSQLTKSLGVRRFVRASCPGALSGCRDSAVSVTGDDCSTELVERLDEILGDVLCGSAFDLPSLEHVHETSILQEADRGR